MKRLEVTQNDAGRPLGVYITRDGSPFDCSDYTVELQLLRPDKSHYTANVSIDSVIPNLAYWETAEEETAVPGECLAQIRLKDGAVDVGTSAFTYNIERLGDDA